MKTRASNIVVKDRTSRVPNRREQSVLKPGMQTEMGEGIIFKNILVPFDFSKSAEAALRYAITVARQFEGKITLVYVVEPTAFADFDTNPLILDNEAAALKAKERLTALRLQQDDDARYISDIKVNIGKPFQEITSLARGLKQDLIIISTHGRTALKHVLLGSTAEKVVRHAHCPVLVVRGK